MGSKELIKNQIGEQQDSAAALSDPKVHTHLNYDLWPLDHTLGQAPLDGFA